MTQCAASDILRGKERGQLVACPDITESHLMCLIAVILDEESQPSKALALSLDLACAMPSSVEKT